MKENGEIEQQKQLSLEKRHTKLKQKYHILVQENKRLQARLDAQKQRYRDLERELEEKRHSCSVGCMSIFDHQRIVQMMQQK